MKEVAKSAFGEGLPDHCSAEVNVRSIQDLAVVAAPAIDFLEGVTNIDLDDGELDPKELYRQA